MPAAEEPGGFELREDAIDRGEPDIGVCVEQHTIDVVGSEVARRAVLEDLENLQSRCRDLQPRTA